MSEQRLRVIDSHTGGEPTRVVVDGGPDLSARGMRQKLNRLRDDFEWFRSAVVNEPRGSDVIVGALLTPPSDPSCVAGVIFFNNVGYLGMCGHGTIGVAVTLNRLGIAGSGTHKIDTPVGVVGYELHDAHRVTIENVPSFFDRTVTLDVPGIGFVTGDIAWGGNWFFLVDNHGLELDVSNASRLVDVTTRIKAALVAEGITGRGEGAIDHIELVGPPHDPDNSGRNFVLCPGNAYDRSPCGTGTSAKLACLAHHGRLREGETWRQESVIGSVFEATYSMRDGQLIPRITGSAYVTADSTLILDPADPFRHGFRS